MGVRKTIQGIHPCDLVRTAAKTGGKRKVKKENRVEIQGIGKEVRLSAKVERLLQEKI